MPALVQQYGFPVLPLEDLVDYPLNLVGLGRKCTSPLGFVILHMQVWEIVGYDEDVVFLVVPDESEFGRRVPLVIGTCTIGRIINVIWESEIDCLSTPWATVRMVQLLSCWKSTAVLASGSAEAQSEGASGGPQEVEVDELVTVRESLHLGPFQAEIIVGWVKPLRETAHVMMGQKVNHGGLDCFLQDSMSFMHTHALQMAVVKCPSLSGTYLTVTSSSRRECQWHKLCRHHPCHLQSCHQRWKPLLSMES